MLYSKEVEVPLTTLIVFWDYYKGLGYDIEKLKLVVPNNFKENGKKLTMGSYKEILVNIPVSHLKEMSKVKVKVLCDYCLEEGQKTIFEQPYQKFQIAQKPLAKDCCRKHKGQKMADVNMINYGVKNVFQLESVKEKSRQTVKENYGVDNILQNEKFKEKIRQTNIEKHGVPYALQSKEIREKCYQTNLERYGYRFPSQNKTIYGRQQETIKERYGVENVSQSEEIKRKKVETTRKNYGVNYPSQSKEINERTRQANFDRYGVEYFFQTEEFQEISKKTMLEKYGVEHIMYLPEIKQKILANSMFTRAKNGLVPTSRQQIYIHKVYGGKLNYPIDRLCLDIAFPDEKLAIEFDGSGHDLSIQFKQMTEEEFKQKEINRSYFLKNNGWKTMRIISLKDRVPMPDKLQEMLLVAKSYFLKNNNSWIEFDIDKNLIKINNESREFDFGELQVIKEEENDFIEES